MGFPQDTSIHILMCKCKNCSEIIWKQELNCSGIRFPLNLNCEGRCTSEMDTWMTFLYPCSTKVKAGILASPCRLPADRIVSALYLLQCSPDPFLIHTSQSSNFRRCVMCIFIRPFEKRTYYAMAMSVRLSVRPSVRPSFPDFFSTCFKISIWNLVYAFSRWHDMSSLSFITIGSLWPSLQAKVGQTQFLQSWPYKSR